MPRHTLEERKKRREEAEALKPGRLKAGTRYVGERERLLSRGATKREAIKIAEERTRGLSSRQVDVPEFLERRETLFKKKGLTAPEVIEKPERIDIIEEEKRGVGDLIKGQFDLANVFGGLIDPQTNQPIGDEKVRRLLGEVGGAVGFGAGVGKAVQGYRVAGQTFGSLKTAVKAGTAIKHSKQVTPLLTKIGGFLLTGYAALKAPELIVSFFAREKVLNEQQSAINTLGQISSSIVGDSTSATGDAKKGLQELRYIKQEIERTEGLIKSGKIASAHLKISGKIYDLDADVYDQLATINEEIRNLESFILSGIAPELSDQELQELSRELESQGILKPVDLKTSRRRT
jgi:hypothetical protein